VNNGSYFPLAFSLQRGFVEGRREYDVVGESATAGYYGLLEAWKVWALTGQLDVVEAAGRKRARQPGRPANGLTRKSLGYPGAPNSTREGGNSDHRTSVP
jgi:hypothetical protein